MQIPASGCLIAVGTSCNPERERREGVGKGGEDGGGVTGKTSGDTRLIKNIHYGLEQDGDVKSAQALEMKMRMT